MATPDMVDPLGSSYDIAKPTHSEDGQLPEMSLDRTLPRQISTGNMRGIQQFGTPNLFADAGNEFFGVSKNDIPQVLMGKQPTFGEGLYVTREGVDVTKTTLASDFIFNSNQNIFKIVQKGTGTIVNNGSTVTTGKIAHGLGFVPVALGFLSNATNSVVGTGLGIPLPIYTNASIDTILGAATASGNPLPIIAFQTYLSVMADELFFYVFLINSTGSPVTYEVTYFLLQESANDGRPESITSV